MARRRRDKKSKTRDVRTITNDTLRSLPNRSPLPFDLSVIEDLRQFHPRPDLVSPRPLLTFPKPRVVARQAYKKPTVLGFDVPANVLVCVRRKMRKEVLHAFNKAGKGGQKRPRRNRFSDLRC